MAPARDHKRAFDDDEGQTRAEWASIRPTRFCRRILRRQLSKDRAPTLDGLRADGLPYRGFLYFGLMLTAGGPKVLEYNCRLGDPETEAVLLRADFDLAQACMRAARGNLEGFEAKWLPGASMCVVIASKGYPGDP